MRRITAVLVAGLLVVGALAVLPTAAMAHAGSDAQPVLDQQDGNETVTDQTTNESANATANATVDDVAPGERLAGVLGVQSAEVEGELETRAFDLAFERADDNASKAEVIAREAADTNERLAELREQREKLREARQNGSMTEGEYRARTAVLATKAETVRNLADRSADASEGLPEETLRANGVNVSAIRALSADAADLSGGEVAAIARSIAGGPDGAVPDRAGGPGERAGSSGNATDADGDVDIERAESEVASAAERVEAARERVNSTNASENATAALDRAESRLAAAEEALADARNASEAGNTDRADELAEQAVEAAANAVEDAEAAIDTVDAETGDRAETPDGSDDDGTDSGGDGATSGGSDAGGSTR